MRKIKIVVGKSRRSRTFSYDGTRTLLEIANISHYNVYRKKKTTLFGYLKSRTMHEEEKWFIPYTWNGEIVTEVLIQPRSKIDSPQIMKVVENYFESLGITQGTHSTLSMIHGGRGKGNLWTAWHIYMVNKRYSRLNFLEVRMHMASKLFSAWPSQLKPYLHEKRGTLTGTKFGI